ncbi:MAG: peroxiredoxin [Desulfobacterota bacterium]|nr:peroxiredoxin [Thermodesulfobacteriota bacterium]
MKNSPDIGSKAPDFSLPATGGTTIRLSEMLKNGPVMLLFYPLDWSPVCTSELCGIRDGFREFQNVGIQVLGISVDSVFSHAAFAEKHGISFPLLSDFNKEVCSAYGVIHEEILGLKGVAKRSVFIIARDGIIKYRWVSEDPTVVPNIDEIKSFVRSNAL